MTLDRRTWSLHAERPAHPGERTASGQPAAFVGYSVGHLPRYLLDPTIVRPEDFGAFLEPLQRRIRERLGVPLSGITWFGSLDLTDDEVAEIVARVVPGDAAVVIERIP
jgi:hypothetical protein